MKRPNFVVLAGATSFSSAIVAALFFHGFQVEFLCIVQALLLVWLGLVLWHSYDGLVVPKTALAVSVMLFWVWLGVSLVWTQVPAIGALNFWWMGSLPLAFWLYVLAPDREAIWRLSSMWVLGLGVVLALLATHQLLVQQQPPRSLFININSHAALMNLLLLPLIGYFLLQMSRAARPPLVAGLGACLFVLTYALAITRGRGAILSFAISLAFFFWAARAHIAKKATLIVGAVLAAAFVAANFSGQGGMLERFDTLSNPTSAGATRFVIWQQAWVMIQELPWWGRGLGTFSLAYPSYRLPSDSSAGAFVHNDYLQIWIEVGLPGLVLFVAVWASLALMFWRSRRTPASGSMQIEIATLTSGLLAVTLHSFFDFNFYQMPILLIAGLMLGRLQHLTLGSQGSFTVRPAVLFGQAGYRTVLVVAIAIPLFYFAATASAAYVYTHALTLAERGDLVQADQAFERAARLAPVGDNIAISRADLYRHALRTTPTMPREHKERLYTDALVWLARAQAQNPLRPLVFGTRGMLYAENPDFAGDRWRELATESYTNALRVDPRFYPARVAYAELLLRTGDTLRARALLEEGLRYWYLDYEAIVPYYVLAARLRREAGDGTGANELEDRIKVAMANSGWSWVPRPDAAPALGSVYGQGPVK